MSQSTTGGGWTAASNATVRAHSGRTSSQHAESEGIRLAGLHNPTQSRTRKSAKTDNGKHNHRDLLVDPVDGHDRCP